MKLSVERFLSQSLDILNLVKSSQGRACLLLIVSLVILAACNRPQERELVEVPTAVNELVALPTNPPPPTVPAAETSPAPTQESTQVADEVASADEASDEAAEIEVAFVEPQDGATVSGTFSVTMSASGILVEPAGDVKDGSGHMHILVDTDFVPAGEAIVNDEQHLHFGNAQLETELALEPGEHVLRLQLADGAHMALEGDEYRDEITVTVADEEAADEDTANEEATDEEATNEEVADEEVADEEVADEETPDEEVADEEVADEEVADEQAADEQATDEADAPVEDENAIVRSPTELWVSMACSACHNINENQTEDNIGQPGPHQNNLYERAGERVEGQTAEEYVYNSIVNTNDFIVEPYMANIMPQNFGERMSEEEIQGLVDWLLDPNRESLP